MNKAENIILKVNDNIKNWYENGGEAKIAKYFVDPDGIFTTAVGVKSGVYGTSVLTPYGKEILMYIGEVGKAGRGFRDRLVEHAKYWIDSSEHFTGVKASELEAGYRYVVRILAEEADDAKRYDLEQRMIEELKPYMQFSCYPKFDSDYRGNDLAIFRTYRRRAFVVARDGKYTEEDNKLFVDNIFKLRDKVDFNDYKTAKPDKKIVDLVEREMPNYSDVWRNVKAFIEASMGITSKRGCRYSYLVRIVAAALEASYKPECVL